MRRDIPLPLLPRRLVEQVGEHKPVLLHPSTPVNRATTGPS